MSRWMIEKSGTGIEKSGTGIEKSGTGIEKSGTGIEKSGTGIRRVAMSLAFACVVFASGIQAQTLDPAGSLQLVVDDDALAVSWIIDGSVFSGVSTVNGTFANFVLTEVSMAIAGSAIDVTGNGTGGSLDVTGNGTGGSLDVTGNGTGGPLDGTGSTIRVTGNGTGNEAIAITLPEGTGLVMEVLLGCGSATVSVLDADSVEVVSFYDVPVIGGADLCGK